MNQKWLRFGDDVGKREFIKFAKKYHQQLDEECASVGRITVCAMSPPRFSQSLVMAYITDTPSQRLDSYIILTLADVG